MHARMLLVALVGFAVASAFGVGFALLGPVMPIRALGAVAFVAGACGCALQLYALREFTPRTYAALRVRVGRYLDRVRAIYGAGPAVLAASR